MTEPAAPAAPAPAPAATEPAPAAPQPSGTDFAAHLAALTAERDEWKARSRQWEGNAKTNKQEAEAVAKRDAAIAKIAAELGIEVGTKAADPEAISRELAATKAQAREHATEAAVLRAASTSGADGDALLDSLTFRNKLKAIDPADAAAVKQLITETVTANPKYATAAAAATTTPAAPPVRNASTGGDFNGAPGGGRQLTGADVDRMTPAQVAKAKNDGLLKDYLAS